MKAGNCANDVPGESLSLSLTYRTPGAAGLAEGVREFFSVIRSTALESVSRLSTDVALKNQKAIRVISSLSHVFLDFRKMPGIFLRTSSHWPAIGLTPGRPTDYEFDA